MKTKNKLNLIDILSIYDLIILNLYKNKLHLLEKQYILINLKFMNIIKEINGYLYNKRMNFIINKKEIDLKSIENFENNVIKIIEKFNSF